MAGKKVKSVLPRQASPEQCFWCCDGRIIKNLVELEKAFNEMSDSIFSYHANSKKNDFAKWVKDILGEGKLASELKKCKNRKDAAKKVSEKLK